MYGETQLFPEKRDTWLTGDNETIEWQEYFKLPDNPTRLRLEGYNESTRYSHTFIIRLVTLPEWIALWQALLARFIKLFARLLGVRL